MAAQRVRVEERWRNPDDEPALGWRVLAQDSGLSVKAAWEFFEEELLFSRNCSKSHVVRADGRRGRIILIYHEDRVGAIRPCRDCLEHRRATYA